MAVAYEDGELSSKLKKLEQHCPYINSKTFSVALNRKKLVPRVSQKVTTKRSFFLEYTLHSMYFSQ